MLTLKDNFEKLKSLQIKLEALIDNDVDVEEHFENLLIFISDDKFFNDANNFKLFLQLISDVVKNHNRSNNFLNRIYKIIFSMKDKIKKTFSNIDLFNIFKNSKIILLFLIEKNIITMNKTIAEIMMKEKYKQMKYLEYFFNEITQFIQDDDIQINKPIGITNEYKEMRRNGENESHLCKLIREDSIEDFIIYVNKNDISLNTKIQLSIYETNSFILKKEPTLIEYSAFYGSIQIFRYLYLNGSETESTIWLYAIHGNNPELISFLENKSIKMPNNNYDECLKESIKCHHTDLINYILNKIDEYRYQNSYEKSAQAYGFHYHNYLHLSNKFNNDNFVFFYMHAIMII